MENISRIQERLLTWYNKNKRDLPWRKTKDPYAIWVSEIMLQQTQVDTVIPYYTRWMKKFDTVKKLAKTPLDEVLRLWEGLGYYARARNLHKGANLIIKKYKGKIPSTSSELIQLQGIGPYTANAIASIAFDEAVPVVDGNVKRVISRIFMIKNNLQEIHTQADQLLAQERAGDFNQAMMELGAMICTPKGPQCCLCPINEYCLAYLMNSQENYPAPSQKIYQKPIETLAGLIHKNGKILIQQRPPSGLLGGLWQFPLVQTLKDSQPKEHLIDSLQRSIEMTVALNKKLGSYRHIYTHLIESLNLYEGQWLKGEIPKEARPSWKWVRVGELNKYAFTGICGKIRKEIGLFRSAYYLKRNSLSDL